LNNTFIQNNNYLDSFQLNNSITKEDFKPLIAAKKKKAININPLFKQYKKERSRNLSMYNPDIHFSKYSTPQNRPKVPLNLRNININIQNPYKKVEINYNTGKENIILTNFPSIK
jgi:hypothetical protein